MKIELKNVKINLAFSEETVMFKADVYVNGVKTAYANNDGHGGSTFYSAYDGSKRALLKEAEDFCQTLPSEFSKLGDKSYEIKMDLEHFIDITIDDLVNKKEEEKLKKKLEKKYINCLIFGKPNTDRYMEVKYKVPFTSFPKEVLQKQVDKYKLELKAGEKFFNTNFEALGIIIEKDLVVS